MCIWAQVFFPLQSPDYYGELPNYPQSWFWVCGEFDRDFSKVHQTTYLYAKTLIWAWKKICNYDRPTLVIVDLPTMVSWKKFFSKARQMAYWYPRTLVLVRKKFCNYGHPTIVIVDLPTMISRIFFSKAHQMAYKHLGALILFQKNKCCGCRINLRKLLLGLKSTKYAQYKISSRF